MSNTMNNTVSNDLDLTLVQVAQGNYSMIERNRRAILYSMECKRKRDEKLCCKLGAIVFVMAIMIIL